MIRPDFDEHLDELCDYAQLIIQAAKAMPAWKFSQAVRRREAWAATVHRWFRDFDFFLAPVMGETARRCDAKFPSEEGRPGAPRPRAGRRGPGLIAGRRSRRKEHPRASMPGRKDNADGRANYRCAAG